MIIHYCHAGFVEASITFLFCTLNRAYVEKESDTILLLFNGNIITMDNSITKPEEIVVKGSIILFLGKLQEALKKAGDTAIKINLKGKTLIPVFNDNHTHTLAAGSFYSEIILWNKTCEDIALIINEEAKKKKPGELITGNSWEPFTVRLLKKYRDSQELSCRFTCWPLGDSPLYYGLGIC